MQPSPRNWLIVVVIVCAGAVAQLSLPARRLLPTTRILSRFPARLGSYSATTDQFVDSERTRRVYAPAEIVYRDYIGEDGTVINLFIGPEPVGWDTPAICAAYKGSTVMKMAVRPVPNATDVRLNEIVTGPDAPNEQLAVCGYYWRTAKGTVNDVSLNILKGKMAALTGQSAFRVQMCTDVADMSSTSAASARLDKFAAAVDPEVKRLVEEAAVTGK